MLPWCIMIDMPRRLPRTCTDAHESLSEESLRFYDTGQPEADVLAIDDFPAMA